ncbi:azurin [Neisseria sp. Ec49-e6-T10]|uniref:azurin n=1 Tax=Neisseria sp. Ec49-e6-T10 TaxID=3140744 RepID=UPI003EBECA89
MKKLLVVPALALFSGIVFAGPCDVTVKGNDAMQYDVKTITVPKTCKNFTVNLVHSGKQTKAAMGHNWILAETKDVNAIAKDGLKAGLAKDYEKPNDKRVLARTKMIGGGEKTSVTFAVSALKEGQAYTYFCTFPGHASVMRGTLTVK